MLQPLHSLSLILFPQDGWERFRANKDRFSSRGLSDDDGMAGVDCDSPYNKWQANQAHIPSPSSYSNYYHQPASATQDPADDVWSPSPEPGDASAESDADGAPAALQAAAWPPVTPLAPRAQAGEAGRRRG